MAFCPRVSKDYWMDVMPVDDEDVERRRMSSFCDEDYKGTMKRCVRMSSVRTSLLNWTDRLPSVLSTEGIHGPN
jgi:hypothetical protein